MLKAFGLIICVLSGGWFFSRWIKRYGFIGTLIGLMTFAGSIYLVRNFYDDFGADLTSKIYDEFGIDLTPALQYVAGAEDQKSDRPILEVFTGQSREWLEEDERVYCANIRNVGGKVFNQEFSSLDWFRVSTTPCRQSSGHAKNFVRAGGGCDLPRAEGNSIGGIEMSAYGMLTWLNELEKLLNRDGICLSFAESHAIMKVEYNDEYGSFHTRIFSIRQKMTKREGGDFRYRDIHVRATNRATWEGKSAAYKRIDDFVEFRRGTYDYNPKLKSTLTHLRSQY